MSMFRNALRRAVARVDGWANLLTGVGPRAGAPNRARYTFQGAERQSLPFLEQLYHEDPFARRIAEAVPAAAMRPGFKVRVGAAAGGPEAETAINGALVDLHAARRIREAWTWGRVHGGGALVLGLDDGQPADAAVDEAALRALRWVVSVTASELVPDEWDRDPRSARFGEPLVYRLQRTGGGGGSDTARVHHTRVIRFEGLPTTRTRRVALQGWGESYLQNVYSLLEEWNGAHAAVTDLLQQASVGVYKMRDLVALIGSDPDELLRKRMEALDLGRSVANSILVDADGEGYDRTEVGALSGLPDLLDRYSLRLSGGINMPVAVFLGRHAQGLNATGEGDTRGWDDSVDAERRSVLVPALERMVKLLLLSSEGPTRGVEPAGWSIVLPPLRTSTPSEEAALRKTVADTDGVYIDRGVNTPEEVARSRFRPEGWSMETLVDLAARETPGVTGDPAQADAVAGIVAKVAARELPRDTGVAMIVDLLGADAATAERLMGEAGRSFFTAPDPAVVAGVDEANARAAKAEASVRGHKAFTARVIAAAKAGGLKLGAFTAREPTEVAEGDVLEEGDVVAVPEAPAPEDPAA